MKILHFIKNKMLMLSDSIFTRNDAIIYVMSVRMFKITTTSGQTYDKTIRELFCEEYDNKILTNEELIDKMLKRKSVLTDQGVYVATNSIDSIEIVRDTTKLM